MFTPQQKSYKENFLYQLTVCNCCRKCILK